MVCSEFFPLRKLQYDVTHRREESQGFSVDSEEQLLGGGAYMTLGWRSGGVRVAFGSD